MIRVLIFDDNSSRRDSLELLIKSSDSLALAGSFPDCMNVVEVTKESKPDVILMDIEMPGINGIYATAILKKEFPQTPIIIQTVFDDNSRVFDAVKAGASGYLLKSSSAERIIQSIKDANEGGAPMSPTIALKMIDYFRNAENIQNKNAKDDYNLSERELQVLKLLVDGKSYKMIADELSVAYHTVNSHIKKIYEKLHVHSVAEAVNIAHKNNIVR